MSTTMNGSVRPPRGLLASLILPSRETKHYRRWQQLHTTLRHTELGGLPTAVEYEEFQQWLKRQDSGYFSEIFDDQPHHVDPPKANLAESELCLPIATLCHHTMHPVSPSRSQPRCPTCTIDMHLEYVKVLARALAAAGGRAPSCTLTSSDHQENIYSAWCKAKLGALASLSELQGLADKESEWSLTHTETSLPDLHTATKAVELYWFETSSFLETKHPTKTTTEVMFSDDTNFELGRPQAYYWRRSPRYEPGNHTVCHDDGEDDDVVSVEEEGEEKNEESDTVSEDSERYDQGPTSDPETTGQVRSDGHILETIDRESEETISLYDDDDSDSDWEDIESDDENPFSVGGVYGSNCAHAGMQVDSSFIVFSSC